MEEKIIVIVTDEDFGEKAGDFKDPMTRTAARGVLVNDKGEIALLNKIKMNEYKLAGGGIDDGETPMQAFKREIYEETGCDCEVLEFLGVAVEEKSKTNFKQFSYVYLAKVTKVGKVHFTEKEISEGARLVWAEPKEALKLITDSKKNLKGSPTDKDEQYEQTKFVVVRDAKILEYYIKNFLGEEMKNSEKTCENLQKNSKKTEKTDKIDRSKLFETLKERGYVYQMSNEENVRKIVNGEPTTVYVGIDPTADSLHIGHFFSLMMIRYFQDAGHHVIVLIGGATAMVGDPSGRTDMRKMLTKEQVEHNLEEVKTIVKRFVKTDGENPAKIVSNAEWFDDISYVNFMRDVGTYFNVNKMLASEAYSRRLAEGGLTFLEMGYMLMQAYDFVHLNKQYGCMLQVGGSDQWGNMVAGCELSRKMAFADGKKHELECLTCPLLTNSEGQKMGKTAKGALWVAREKTSVFDFYQYFYNVQDKDVSTLLRLFTRIPLCEIDSLVESDIIAAKKRMAFEITKLVHGEADAIEAQRMSENLFVSGGDDAPEVEVAETLFDMSMADLVFAMGLATSKSEARRLIQGGAISFKGEKVIDFAQTVSAKDADGALLKKGKKSFVKVKIAKK